MRMVSPVIMAKIALGQPVTREKILSDHRAKHRSGHAAEEAACHHPAKAGSRGGNPGEQSLHRAGLAHFRAGGKTCERLRILVGVCAIRSRHFGAELFEQHLALLRSEPSECLDVRLLDGFRRRGLQQLAVTSERLLVLTQSCLLPLVSAPTRLVGGAEAIEDTHVAISLRGDDTCDAPERRKVDLAGY